MTAIHSPTLSTPAAARLLGVHPQALRRWRKQGSGPVCFRIGRNRFRYRHEDLEGWLRTRRTGDSVPTQQEPVNAAQ
jgi:DNA-binding transcriptional MerR regulator